MSIEDLVRILQASIAPCIFISGLGLLLLSMTNRLTRPVDRIRSMFHEIDSASSEQTALMHKQMAIYYKRCRLLQIAIALIVASIFFVSVIMLMLFSTLVFDLQLVFFIKLFFMISLVCLIVALTFFLFDIRITLKSLKIEVKKYIQV